MRERVRSFKRQPQAEAQLTFKDRVEQFWKWYRRSCSSIFRSHRIWQMLREHSAPSGSTINYFAHAKRGQRIVL
ncbi:MAG: hypothetical protein C5B50_28485 [Verrucomicrobia bacterium]|nr:MAG: hypothetical protein C5B50_28485 [Verrucomicrobiota bacterium]